MTEHVRAAIQNAGITVKDEVFAEALTYSGIPENEKFEGTYNLKSRRFAMQLLTDTGIGDYDFDSDEWTPTSSEVFAFDLEVYDVSNMYALFLKGVQSIVPDIEISNVREDLALITGEITETEDFSEPPSDGARTVSFLCNGNKYETKLKSYCDWLNLDIVDFLNDVLARENCPGRLHLLTQDDADQMCLLIYGSSERAEAILRLIRA